MKKWLKLVTFVYLFVLSIEIIKRASMLLAPDIKNFLYTELNPIKAVSVGWFTTSLVQSSGAVSTVAATFAGNNIIPLTTTAYIIIGATLGTSITALIISMIITTKKRRDFRHGFEIGLSHAISSIILGIIAFFLEFFFKLFSRLSLLLAKILEGKILLLKIPNIIDIITLPIINPLFEKNHKILILIISFATLIISLKYISKSIIEVLGGENNARKFLNKYFQSKYKAYLMGIGLTAILFSSSITIGLLVPLATSRLINLKKAIPFILGAHIGTSTDVFLAALIIGKTNALATSITYILLGVLATIIFFPNIEFLHKATKYTSKRLIHLSRKKALYILIAFILIPLLMSLIF